MVYNGASTWEGGSSMEGYLTAKQAAEKAGVSDAWIRELCGQGRFPGAIQPGRDWFIPTSDIELWLTTIDRDRRKKAYRQKMG